MRIVHETPGRLRLRLAGGPARLAGAADALRDLGGVAEVRTNPGCGALVVRFDPGGGPDVGPDRGPDRGPGGGPRADGGPGLRDRILACAARAPAVRPDAFAAQSLLPTGSAADNPERGRLALAALAVAGAAALPRPLAVAATLLNVAGPVFGGVRAAATEGLKVEVLDALAIGLPTLRGELVTANFTRFLMELAVYIEATTAAKSDDLLRSLLRRPPADVRIEGAGGDLVTLPFAALRGGERVVVGLGEAIPVDGRVLDGAAYVDQSAVTGESLPLPRNPGDEALAGGIVTAGRLVVRADRIGASTTTGKIAAYIQEALERPAEIETASDRMADRRVGITLASAAGVLALTRDIRRMESVFMVDYSCTVKLGTPIAIKSAMYRAARQGCLVKSGPALEALAGVDTFVFDKTGTLTHNTLQVTDIEPLAPGVGDDDALAVVASLGEHTNHPIARALVSLARERHLAHVPHEEVNFIVGHGVESVVGGSAVSFGSRRFLEDDEKVSFAAQRETVARLEGEGKSLLYAARGERPLAVFALRDRLRRESAGTLSRLRDLGVKRLVMITGDHRAKALAFGEALGMDEIHFEQKPEDKARIIAGLRARGARVAYVGDGVNDGPALMAANVGIAMPRAADIARATADIVMLDERLETLAGLLDLSQETMRLVQSNFRVAVGVNSAILLGAVTGRLAPLTTAALHNGTTIAVLLRSMLAARSFGAAGGTRARR